MKSFVVCCLAVVLLQDAVRASVEDDIREEIFEDGDYNKARHPNNQVELTYNVRYTDCPTLDTSTGMLTGHIRETQEWTDNRLSWDQGEHDEDSITVSADEVWTPGMSLVSSGGEIVPTEDDELTLSANGKLKRSRKLDVSSHCDQSGTAWKCQLRFMQWKNAGPNFQMEKGTTDRISRCRDTESLKVEEYKVEVTREGGIGNSYYYYTIDMVIQLQ